MIKLIQGDCIPIMESMEPGSVHAILTDLPYGTTGRPWDEVIPFPIMWNVIERVLKPGGVFLTTASQPFTSALIMSNLSWFKYEWIWDKRLAGNAMLSDFQPLKIHENILVFSDGPHMYNMQTRRGRMRTKLTDAAWDSTFGKQTSKATKNDVYKPTSILDFAVPRVGRKHPTQKSVALYEYLIRTYTDPGQTVLDMCMGSGTTIQAAKQTGRDGIGIEKDPAYFKTAQKKVNEAPPALFA